MGWVSPREAFGQALEVTLQTNANDKPSDMLGKTDWLARTILATAGEVVPWEITPQTCIDLKLNRRYDSTGSS